MRGSVAACVAMGCCLLAGCGFGEDELPERVQGPSLLSRQAVEQLPEGSPQRALYEWWRTIQFDNPVDAVRFYSDRLNMTTAKLENSLKWGTNSLGLGQRPRLVEVQQDGNDATVLLLLESEADNPNGRVDIVRTARAFNLIREGGDWKLAENLWLERNARIQDFFSRAQQRQEEARLAGERENGPQP